MSRRENKELADKADFFFLVLFLLATEPDFTSSESERIECLTAIRDLNAFELMKEKISGDEV